MSYTKEEQLARIEKCRSLLHTKEQDDPKLYHVCVVSTVRVQGTFIKLLNAYCDKDWLKTHVTYFVAEDEYDAYKNSGLYENVRLHTLSLTRQGVGYDRRDAFTILKEEGYKYVMMFDDDITRLAFTYANDVGCKYHHSTDADYKLVSNLTQRVLEAAAYCSLYLFEQEPSLLIGSMRIQHFCCKKDVSSTLALVNRGNSPHHLYIWRMSDYSNDYFPESSRYHGDDIIATAIALQNNKSVFLLQWLMLDYVSEQQNSTLRDKDEWSERNRQIHAKERATLDQYEIKNYLAITKMYGNGDYMYGDVYWQRYALVHPDKKGVAVPVEVLDEL